MLFADVKYQLTSKSISFLDRFKNACAKLQSKLQGRSIYQAKVSSSASKESLGNDVRIVSIGVMDKTINSANNLQQTLNKRLEAMKKTQSSNQQNIIAKKQLSDYEKELLREEKMYEDKFRKLQEKSRMIMEPPKPKQRIGLTQNLKFFFHNSCRHVKEFWSSNSKKGSLAIAKTVIPQVIKNKSTLPGKEPTAVKSTLPNIKPTAVKSTLAGKEPTGVGKTKPLDAGKPQPKPKDGCDDDAKPKTNSMDGSRPTVTRAIDIAIKHTSKIDSLRSIETEPLKPETMKAEQSSTIELDRLNQRGMKPRNNIPIQQKVTGVEVTPTKSIKTEQTSVIGPDKLNQSETNSRKKIAIKQTVSELEVPPKENKVVQIRSSSKKSPEVVNNGLPKANKPCDKQMSTKPTDDSSKPDQPNEPKSKKIPIGLQESKSMKEAEKNEPAKVVERELPQPSTPPNILEANESIKVQTADTAKTNELAKTVTEDKNITFWELKSIAEKEPQNHEKPFVEIKIKNISPNRNVAEPKTETKQESEKLSEVTTTLEVPAPKTSRNTISKVGENLNISETKPGNIGSKPELESINFPINQTIESFTKYLSDVKDSETKGTIAATKIPPNTGSASIAIQKGMDPQKTSSDAAPNDFPITKAVESFTKVLSDVDSISSPTKEVNKPEGISSKTEDSIIRAKEAIDSTNISPVIESVSHPNKEAIELKTTSLKQDIDLINKFPYKNSIERSNIPDLIKEASIESKPLDIQLLGKLPEDITARKHAQHAINERIEARRKELRRLELKRIDSKRLKAKKDRLKKLSENIFKSMDIPDRRLNRIDPDAVAERSKITKHNLEIFRKFVVSNDKIGGWKDLLSDQERAIKTLDDIEKSFEKFSDKINKIKEKRRGLHDEIEKIKLAVKEVLPDPKTPKKP